MEALSDSFDPHFSVTGPSSVDSPDQESDTDLMRCLARGNLNCLASLVRRHQKRVRCLAYRFTGRWDLADDVTQEAFLRLNRSASGYQPNAAFSSWLYRIVVNLCLDLARKPRLASLAEVEGPSAPPAEGELERQERQHAVARAVADLPERQRIALILHRFEGLTHGEISQSTGWSEGAIESLLTRAYAQLRQALQPWKAD